ncbi:MAG: formyltransferase family protein [Acidobacteria bacterium]|nr:formyltransferase family protein [Acidobacteriota bacterium]
MKLLLCTKNDLFGAIILNYLLPELRHHEIRILLSDKARTGEDTIPELRAEKFLEREYPLQHFFPTLDREGITGQWLTFNALSAKFGTSIECEYDINGTGSTQRLTTWAPDLILSARFSLIFKPHILALARLGAYNVHPGVLPGYAGVLAPLRALWNAEPSLGCTVHQLDRGIDTGPVYSISRLAATPGRAVQSYIPDLYRLGIDSLLELVQSIESGHRPKLAPQDTAAFRYFRPPTAEDYRAKDVPLFDFSDYTKLLQQFSPADADSESRRGSYRSTVESLLSQHLKQSAAPL